MDLLAEISVVVLCVLAIAAAAWWLYGRMLCGGDCGASCIVLRCPGDAVHLEQTVRRLMWLRDVGLLTCQIVISPEALSPEGKVVLTKLMQRWPCLMTEYGAVHSSDID